MVPTDKVHQGSPLEEEGEEGEEVVGEHGVNLADRIPIMQGKEEEGVSQINQGHHVEGQLQGSETGEEIRKARQTSIQTSKILQFKILLCRNYNPVFLNML